MIFWVAILWIPAGILAYGMYKNHLRQRFSTEWKHIGHDSRHEIVCRVTGLSGICGFLAVIIFIILIGNSKLGLCYRMPQELCKPRRS